MIAQTAELRPHPRTPGEAVRRIDIAVDADEWPHSLRFRFRIEGDIGRLELPPPGNARRTDGLWQHTCFEAFLRADGDESYHEFNFSPSGDWAAYRFGARRGGRSFPELPAPVVRFQAGAERCDLSAELAVRALPELARASSLQAGIAAVVEARGGALSYWALAHGDGRPDFHDPATFALRIGSA